MRLALSLSAALLLIAPTATSDSPSPSELPEGLAAMCWLALDGSTLQDEICAAAQVPCRDVYESDQDHGPVWVRTPSAQFAGFGVYEFVGTRDNMWVYSGYYAHANEHCIHLPGP